MAYVEKEKVLEIAKDKYYSDFHKSMADLTSLRELLEDTPAADVVDVVRCKDCKHAILDLMKKGLVVCRRPVLKNGQLLPFNWENKYNDFCSYGERKDGE